MAHPLGGYFDVPHGVANAILLPVVMEFNAQADQGRYQKIYNYLVPDKISEEKFVPEVLMKELQELTASLGIPQKLKEVGVTEDKIPEMAADAMKSGNILSIRERQLKKM